jgi:glycosyltransferase involved in cell wall biosynthesis
MISVIIPTKNRPDFLLQAVQSVLLQTHAEFEILVVNDGDDLIQFNHEKIRVLNNQKRGAVVARNFGVTQTRGTHIAFLDDDDMWIDRQHLERAAVRDAEFYFADGVMKFADGTSSAFAHDANVETLAHDNTILISAVVYEKVLHGKLGMFDETLPYYWDWDWYLRAARSGASFYHCDIPAVDIRVHAQNMSADQNQSARQANLNLLCSKHNLQNITLKNHVDFVK